MKRFTLLLILIVATISAHAQTKSFFEAGLAGSYGSNSRETSFPEVYGALGVKLFEFKDSTIQVRARGRYSKTPELQDLFTRDNNPERIPSGEFRGAAGIRWNLSTESYFKPFVEAGAELTQHFGLPSAPTRALQPTLSFGTRAGYGYEIGYTRLFADRLNRASLFGSSKLRGDRLGVNYSFKLAGSLHFKFGAEGDYVSYRACADNACDGYREYDWTVRPFAAISFY